MNAINALKIENLKNLKNRGKKPIILANLKNQGI